MFSMCMGRYTSCIVQWFKKIVTWENKFEIWHYGVWERVVREVYGSKCGLTLRRADTGDDLKRESKKNCSWLNGDTTEQEFWDVFPEAENVWILQQTECFDFVSCVL
jgi:hypothetical protein